jgi:hypothetical protein
MTQLDTARQDNLSISQRTRKQHEDDQSDDRDNDDHDNHFRVAEALGRDDE